ncbi:UDP-N-acetylmuramoyl-tripeptide--D-alanyl-D-alanine ligase [Nocardioides oleivorans]|uniref:UDP-N-acetylmuramoyl-tripeptide--D-alanyl-D-alanine ligase n=1 Tax=Nocardioides oleivorans TaxID=273676 RepID=A0A4Q2S326_9ACTN|nr:UDP-N-acetylmuramoyl-tripeptide--D-alanyl-D-alanine ligase [Nocardioides oleivorans]RYB95948.1 UDP-N-acetylmuramoyl-tripeptide--D-alanyl-D-alanine ligase [Nocardioides oleivorans]
MTLAEIADVVGGVAHGDATVTGGAFLDTRTPEAGGLFVAISGERVDGHDFAAAAGEAGAVAVLGSRTTELPTVVVDDVTGALGRLARHVVDALPDVTVLAMTGSQGKTGTKDYLAHLLGEAAPTVATRGNFNNELGVPLTVLRATPETRYLVVEMGARGVGHIAELCAIAPPRVAAVLNVGTAHIGEFGSREAIARAKGEIVEALPADGTAVLNADDDLVAAMAPRTRAAVTTFGSTSGGPTDVVVSEVTTDEIGRQSFEITHRGAGATVHLAQIGAFQWRNAAAAAAMALAAGLDLDTVADTLGDVVPASRWRMEVTERADGVVVINDAYNANPESVRAALETLGGIGARSGRRTIAVLGEMRELGDGSAEAHRGVGDYAARVGVDVLVSVGAGGISDGFAAVEQSQAGGGVTIPTAGRGEAVEWLRQNVSAADVVLVKASRGAALELIADDLLAESGNEGRSTG